MPVNGPALFSARAAIEIALKALEVHRWEGTEVDQFPVNRRYDQAAANDNFRAGNSGALSVVTEKKRLTRLFSGEWPTIRELSRSDPMGSSPNHSVINPYLQHWQVSNLFVLGASAFPQNASANPTPTILALTYRTADAVVNRYLKNPAALA